MSSSSSTARRPWPRARRDIIRRALAPLLDNAHRHAASAVTLELAASATPCSSPSATTAPASPPAGRVRLRPRHPRHLPRLRRPRPPPLPPPNPLLRRRHHPRPRPRRPLHPDPAGRPRQGAGGTAALGAARSGGAARRSRAVQGRWRSDTQLRIATGDSRPIGSTTAPPLPTTAALGPEVPRRVEARVPTAATAERRAAANRHGGFAIDRQYNRAAAAAHRGRQGRNRRRQTRRVYRQRRRRSDGSRASTRGIRDR